MRISLVTTALICICLNANAQYKKASFLNKGGRTYGVTGRMSFIGQSNCLQTDIAFSIGKDKDSRRYFSWSDIELMMPTKFKYNTTGEVYDYNTGITSTKPVEVKAKSIFGFAYRFNAGFYLLDNGNESNKVLPFVTVGANVMLNFNSVDIDDEGYTTNPSDVYDLDKYPYDVPTFSLGGNAGVGVLWKITPKFGLMATGGYNFQTKPLNPEDIDPELSSSEGTSYYSYYKSHPYVTFGIRFRIASRD